MRRVESDPAWSYDRLYDVHPSLGQLDLQTPDAVEMLRAGGLPRVPPVVTGHTSLDGP